MFDFSHAEIAELLGKTDADAVFGANLIGGDARRVGLERKDDQVHHGADVVGRSARRDIEVDPRTVDFRQRFAEPGREVPLVSDTDVIVCGAGPAGVSAAITA